MEWIWLIIVGAIVGALGRFINPGRDPMGLIVTILLGIASLVVAGLIFGGALQFIVGVVVADHPRHDRRTRDGRPRHRRSRRPRELGRLRGAHGPAETSAPP